LQQRAALPKLRLQFLAELLDRSEEAAPLDGGTTPTEASDQGCAPPRRIVYRCLNSMEWEEACCSEVRRGKKSALSWRTRRFGGSPAEARAEQAGGAEDALSASWGPRQLWVPTELRANQREADGELAAQLVRLYVASLEEAQAACELVAREGVVPAGGPCEAASEDALSEQLPEPPSSAGGPCKLQDAQRGSEGLPEPPSGAAGPCKLQDAQRGSEQLQSDIRSLEQLMRENALGRLISCLIFGSCYFGRR